MVNNQPAFVGFDRWAARPDALVIPPIIRAGSHHHLVIGPVDKIITVSDPDVRRATVKDRVTTIDLLREQDMIFILSAFKRADFFPCYQVRAFGNHWKKAGFTVSGVAHIENAVYFGDARVFNPAIIVTARWRKDWLFELIKSESIGARRVANRRSGIHT